MKISYRNNIINNGFNNFNTLLTIFNSLFDFNVCKTAPFSEILCHVEASHLQFNENQLTGFSMMWVFTERCLQPDFHFSFNVNVNATVANYMNRNSREMKLYNFLQKWIDLIISRTIKPESTSKAALFETNSQILLFYILFLFIFEA